VAAQLAKLARPTATRQLVRPGPRAKHRARSRAWRPSAHSATAATSLPAALWPEKRGARVAPAPRKRQECAGKVRIDWCSLKSLGTGEGQKKGSAAAFSGELGATAVGGVLHRDREKEGTQAQLNPVEERQCSAWGLLSP
jgi:hypothetical protein